MATTTDCMTNPLEGHPAKSEEQVVASTESLVSQPQPGSMRELLTIAIPMVISAGSQSLMHIIDRIYLTWHHVDEVAAALPAGIIFWAVLSIFHGMGSYVNTFVAQYEGAVRPDRVAATMWQGFYFALISGGLLMLLAPFSAMFLRWLVMMSIFKGMNRPICRFFCWEEFRPFWRPFWGLFSQVAARPLSSCLSTSSVSPLTRYSIMRLSLGGAQFQKWGSLVVH